MFQRTNLLQKSGLIASAMQVLSPGRAENIVSWPSLGLTLRGGAASERVAPNRFNLTIDSFTLDVGSVSVPLLRLTSSAPALVVRDAPAVREGSQLVSAGTASARQRVLNKRQGWLEVLYVDKGGAGRGPLRVSRADTGLLYLHERVAA